MRPLRPGAVWWLALGLGLLAAWGIWTQTRTSSEPVPATPDRAVKGAETQ